MQIQNKFSLLRSILRALGLSQAAVDDIVDRILDFLSDNDERKPQKIYPYALRDNFLSKAELNFYHMLRSGVSPEVTVLAKVSLGDLFYVKSGDNSEWRIYTNKIDRKHVDFLLCDRRTMQPLAGIELDDRSHRRSDRQERDAFVGQVFAAAGLPLHRVRVQRSYVPAELRTLLGELAVDMSVQCNLLDEPSDKSPTQSPVTAAPTQPVRTKTPTMQASADTTAPVIATSASTMTPNALPGESLFAAKPQILMPPAVPMATPECPKCGSAMVLRTARQGVNRGGQFWGCSQYPKCYGIVAVR